MKGINKLLSIGWGFAKNITESLCILLFGVVIFIVIIPLLILTKNQ